MTRRKLVRWGLLILALALSSQIASHLVAPAAVRDATDPVYWLAAGGDNVYYVSTHGDDSNPPGQAQQEILTPRAYLPLVLRGGVSYYVDSVNGSDANPGTSEDRPWRTLAPIHAHAFEPGDVIHFKRGSRWTGGLVIDDSGVEGIPITFKTYGTGNRPIFENPGDPQTIAINADWVVLEGVLVREARVAGVNISDGSDHNIVRDIEATKVGIGIAIHGRHNLATRNYVHDLRLVQGHNWGAVGIWLYNSDNEVSYNKMVNCKAPGPDPSDGFVGGALEWWGDVDNVDHCYVHHNWASECDGFLEVGAKNHESVRDTVVAYNVSLNNGLFSYIHLSGAYRTYVKDFRVENNTIVETGSSGYGVIRFRGDPNPGTFLLRNTIIYMENFQLVSDSPDFTHDHNLYYLVGGGQLGFPLGEGEAIADPLFVDLNGGDFHLQAGSPAIDAGVDLEYSLDFDDRPVPVGLAPDIGAYEYSGPLAAAPGQPSP